MAIRPTILAVHRWLTFVVGVLFVLITFTGAVLVYEDALDRALAPELFRATPGDVGADRVVASIRAAHPEARLTRVWLPAGDRAVYIGELQRRRQRPLAVHVDPGTGRLLGARGPSLLTLTHALHVNLLGIPGGAKIVGAVGALLLLMSVTGLWLWWPGIRKLSLGFRLRRRSGAATLSYDLHNLGGILSLPVVALTALTGVMLVFPTPTQRAAHALFGGTPREYRPPTSSAPPSPDARPLPLADLLAAARAAVPGHTPMLLSIPDTREATVQVRMFVPSNPTPDGAARVTLDQYGGRVLELRAPERMSAPQRFLHRWPYNLHIGTFGGPVIRVLWLVLGFIPTGLAATGLLWWWLRRSKRAALEERRARAA
jgi:uncharacterized iron-regulated membrane protein